MFIDYYDFFDFAVFFTRLFIQLPLEPATFILFELRSLFIAHISVGWCLSDPGTVQAVSLHHLEVKSGCRVLQ